MPKLKKLVIPRIKAHPMAIIWLLILILKVEKKVFIIVFGMKDRINPKIKKRG